MRLLIVAAVMLSLLVPAARAQTWSYTLRVNGMTCPYCAYAVERKLMEIQGVVRVDIDLNAGAVRVFMIEGIELRASTARRAVRGAGFTMRYFQGPGGR